MNAVPLTELADDHLWQRSREGDRAAFGQIVERYQSLICSLAYSTCGNLAQSEDLGQEAFIAAWEKLGDLREPARLRAWLCGIVRNRAANALRRQQRRGPVESLNPAVEPTASDADPAAQAVTREEATLLWRTLAELPETYREPLVLFYRQGQSVAEVAQSLDLAEEAVKQRLSRGRSLLRDELASVVETTLTRTRPTRAFTTAVLAILPAVTTPSAAAAAIKGLASGPGAVVAKGVFGSLGNAAIIGPAIGLLIGLLSAKAAASTAPSPEERACVHRHARRMVLFCFVMSIGLVVGLSQMFDGSVASPVWVVFGLLAWMAVLIATVTWISSRMHHDVLRIRAATGTSDEAGGEAGAKTGLMRGCPWVYESKRRFLGLPLVAVCCGATDAGSSRTRKAVGWIAFGDVAVSPLLAVGGFAVAPFAVGAVTVGVFSFSVWGVAVGVLAFGSVAVGWWAFGLGAIGWQAAAGGWVMANDYAVGAIARAPEANTPAASEWFLSQWFFTPLVLFLYLMHVAILLGLLVLLARLVWVLWRLWRRREVPG